MRIQLTERAVASLASAPPDVQRAFIKQIAFLARGLRHPSLRAKKYDEPADLWQARVNDDWRFWFEIDDDACLLHNGRAVAPEMSCRYLGNSAIQIFPVRSRLYDQDPQTGIAAKI